MKITFVLFSTIIFTIFLTGQANAYIDPGTGSMMVQALLAIIATVSVSVGIFWKHIRFFFTRLFRRNNDE